VTAALRIAGLILAGGEGRRMGGADKAFLILRGEPLVARSLAYLSTQVTALAISANGDPSRFERFGVPVLADEVLGPDGGRIGPAAGILAGLRWAGRLGYDALATIAVDTPFLPEGLVARLAGELGDAGIALASQDGTVHPTIGIWRTETEVALAALVAAGERKLRVIADRLGAVTVDFADAGAAAFDNLNTPGDLRRTGAKAP
jgi:molybdopterin-guanine dinucleotide biosynthesis protein A